MDRNINSIESAETLINNISDFAPDGTEAGVGLALQDKQGRYIFFLAGTRHGCPPGEIFYAGIGGHKEAGEDWIGCAHREALEEIGTDVDILSSTDTWLITRNNKVKKVALSDQPTPLALYEMIHPAGTPRAGKLYRIVIYPARLQRQPKELQPEEVQGVIAMTKKQVLNGLDKKITITDLVSGGGQLIAGGEHLAGHTRLYPLGTARALAEIFRSIGDNK